MFESYKDIVSLEDLQSMLDIGKNKAYELLKNGDIASFKTGREYKIPKTAIIDYVNNQMHISKEAVTFEK